MMEWVEGRTIRRCLDEYLDEKGDVWGVTGDKEQDGDQGEERQRELMDLMSKVGKAVGKMHEVGVVHGDLTTSNLMLRAHTVRLSSGSTDQESRSQGIREGEDGQRLEQEAVSALNNLQGDVALIDFGLAAFSFADEDRAVDLYVLERAFISTHPRAEALFQEILKVYGDSFKGARVVLKRLEDVRQRGRKKSMIG